MSDPKSKSHAIRILKSVLITISFMTLGMTEGARGPCLLDLADLYGTTVDRISYSFLALSLGGLLGCFLMGPLLDWLKSYRSLLMFALLLTYGSLTSLIPFMGSVHVFFAFCVVFGLTGGALSTGGNMYCLELWRGLDGGPWMHSIHFGYALGAFIAPILAAPFLSTEDDAGNDPVDANGTIVEKTADFQTQITQLYPAMGIATMIVSIGFFCFGVSELGGLIRKRKIHATSQPEEKTSTVPEGLSKGTLHRIVIPMGVFFFVYVGAEVTFGNFLTVFGVNCDLSLSRAEGAHITAIFWGTFTAMRCFAIFAAIKLDPKMIMALSFTLSTVGAGILSYWAETSVLLLQVGTGLVGLGSATIYATGLLWLESYIMISSQIGAFFSIMSSLGPKVFPVLIGQVIEEDPMLLMYTTLEMFLACLVLFLFVALNGETLRRKKLFNTLQSLKSIERLNEVLRL